MDRSAAERRRLVARRRRNALLGVGGLAAALGVIVGAGAGGDGDQEPGQAAAPPSCPREIASDPRRLAGSVLVVRMEDSASEELVRLARRGELGGVILFPSTGIAPSVLAKEVDRLRDAARKAGFPEPFVLIDQEGGEVKRLPDEPPDIAPRAMAGSGGADTARAQGLVTGNALARIGIDVDLAPVLDLGTEGSFVAERTFGSEPAEVGELGLAFADGLERAHVAATTKHFPGLGEATESSDTGPSAVDASREELEPGLEPFRDAIAASVPLVMVSNATYSAYDDQLPASISPRIVDGLLRHALGYEGVVITDDLGAGAITAAGLDEAQAAVAAANAGADLLLFALTDGRAAREALVDGLRRGEIDEAALVESCDRLAALRARLAG